VPLAILSDVHGNLHALQAVWADIERQQPDAVFCLGDLVGYGAFPNEVVDFHRARSIPTVMGNYDEGVGFDLDECGCAYRTPEERKRGDRSLRWTQEHTTPENKTFLRGLPRQLRMDGLLLVHGSPRRINEYLYEDRPTETFERIAQREGPGIIAFGHTHLPYLKQVGATWFVNAGSVGRPRDGDTRAGYVLVTPGAATPCEFRRVPYDAAQAAAAVGASGLPEAFAEDLISGGTLAAGGIEAGDEKGAAL
jgi:putative phosphoesterase